MTRFAFYGRVSTEDQQDPVASRGWQMARAEALISPAGGFVVQEFFDVGQSRSLPWKRRPEAARLLQAIRADDRTFDAVVIGEPQRAFYGAQFGETFPVLTHYGVELWVPEIGGRVDPGSEAHDLVMMLFGGMSKGERNRVKVRVRAAMGQQATEGRFLGGRPPYGYRLADAGPHPKPDKAAAGLRQHRLEPDPTTALIVVRMFDDYIAGSGLFAIAERLTADGVPCPSAADPARNRHRSGIAWSKSAVRAILQNPRYTGRQVWNRQRRDEQLVDVEDVALGHTTRLRWNDPADWVWSTELAQEPIIDAATFARAQEQRGAGAHRPAGRKPRRTPRDYMLRGVLFCGLCGRKMQGNWNHNQAHYRCRLASEYALANKVDHPKTVYLREAPVLEALDAWIASLFDPEAIEETCRRLTEAQGPVEADFAAVEAAQRKLGDCDQRLGKHRAALEAGADPTVVSGWIAEVQGERLAAERSLAAAQPAQEMLSPTDLRTLVDRLGDLGPMLRTSNPKERAKVYADLGVTLTYRPDRDLVEVEAVPVAACAYERVGGGI